MNQYKENDFIMTSTFTKYTKLYIFLPYNDNALFLIDLQQTRYSLL